MSDRTLREIESDIDYLRASARAAARGLKSTGDLTDKGIRDAFDRRAASEQWQTRLEDLEREARAAMASAATRRDERRARLTTPTGSVEEQLLAELRASRRGRRLEAILADGPGGLIDLVVNAEDADLSILVDTVTDHYTAAGGGPGRAGMETLEVALQQRDPAYAAAASTAGRAPSYGPVLEERMRYTKAAVASPDAGDPTPNALANVSVTAMGDAVADLTA